MMSQIYRDSGQGGEVYLPGRQDSKEDHREEGDGKEKENKLLTGKIVDGVIKKAK